MNVKPLKKLVLVAENVSKTEVSAGGIILENAESLRESRTATVLAVGPEVTMVSVGDKILLEWNRGHVVKVGDAQRVIVSEDFIVAVL
jgi:co-chaperonin GroES (HSP10)